jgi:hypothetical protein
MASLGYLSHRSKSLCFEFVPKAQAVPFESVDKQQGIAEEQERAAGNRDKPIP